VRTLDGDSTLESCRAKKTPEVHAAHPTRCDHLVQLVAAYDARGGPGSPLIHRVAQQSYQRRAASVELMTKWTLRIIGARLRRHRHRAQERSGSRFPEIVNRERQIVSGSCILCPVRRKWIVAGVVVAAAIVAAGAWQYRKSKRAVHLTHAEVARVCPMAYPLGPACAPCIATFCCREITTCYSSNECIDLNDCWVESGEDEGQREHDIAGRERACERKSPGAVAIFHAWDDCARKYCEDVCPRGPEEDEEEELLRGATRK
jgi:hypothetical protein